MSVEQIKSIVIKVILQLQKDGIISENVKINDSTCLYGPNGALASIHLITAVIDIESEISLVYGKRISLTDPKMFSTKRSPFASIDELSNFTFELLNNK